MIVRRFMYWLRVTVTASLRGARQRSAEPSAREPMLVGSATPRAATGQAAIGLSLSSWLDNGRRLRPRLRMAPRDIGASPTRPLRQKTAPMVSPASAEIPAPRITLTPIAPEPDDTPIAVPVVPAAQVYEEQGDDLTNLEHLDTQTRRLMLLRHLVRKRVFNEGFVGDDIPRQYRKSLGLEAQPPQE
ncbi:MAG TPA: hypothetical protein VGF38_19625 [Ktedonobacterales bacterium]